LRIPLHPRLLPAAAAAVLLLLLVRWLIFCFFARLLVLLGRWTNHQLPTS
jgi:hypothetical protein